MKDSISKKKHRPLGVTITVICLSIWFGIAMIMSVVGLFKLLIYGQSILNQYQSAVLAGTGFWQYLFSIVLISIVSAGLFYFWKLNKQATRLLFIYTATVTLTGIYQIFLASDFKFELELSEAKILGKVVTYLVLWAITGYAFSLQRKGVLA